jgi:hypothetical protein
MKRRIAAALAALLIFVPAAAAGLRLGVKGGYALGLDASRSGAFAFGIDVELDIASNLRLSLGFQRSEGAMAASARGLSAGNLAVIPIEAGLELRFPFGRLPLTAVAGLSGGFGLASFAYDATAASAWDAVGFTVAETVRGALCAGAMVGLEYALTPTSSLLLEARYRLMRSTGTWSMTDRRGGLSTSGTIDALNFDTLTLGLAVRIGL